MPVRLGGIEVETLVEAKETMGVKVPVTSPKWVYHIDNRQSTTRREPTLDDLFDSESLTLYSDIVRESIQNSLDARSDSLSTDAPVIVRFSLGSLPWKQSSFWLSGAEDHLRSEKSRVKASLKGCYGRTTEFLCIEDFGTTGLQGSFWPDAGLTAFNAFYRAEGISPKSNGKRGSRGVGKITFQRTSKLRLMFGLTVRESNELDGPGPLLMGVSTNAWHSLAADTYTPDAQFGFGHVVAAGTPNQESIVIPISGADDSTVAQFVRDFGITRRSEPGFSAVVPFLKSGVSMEILSAAILEQYYVPILRGHLRIELMREGKIETVISAENVSTVAHRQVGEELKRQIDFAHRALVLQDVARLEVNLGSSNLRQALESQIPAETLRALLLSDKKIAAVAINISFDRLEEGHLTQVFDQFTVYLIVDEGKGSRPLYLREGLTVANSHISQNHVSGGMAIVEAKEGQLANLLRASENGAHTQFQPRKEKVSDQYRFGERVVGNFLNSHREIMRLVSASVGEKDFSALARFFPDAGDIRGERPQIDEVGAIEDPADLPPNSEQSVSISTGAMDGHAQITLGFPAGTGTYLVRAAVRELGVDAFRQQAKDKARGVDPFSPSLSLRNGNVLGNGLSISEAPDALSLIVEVNQPAAQMLILRIDPIFDIEIVVAPVLGESFHA